jgi:hypothetical protein
MSSLVFDGDENRLSLFDNAGRFVDSWQASNRGGPKSDHHIDRHESYLTYIPDGEYPFERHSQHTLQKRSDNGIDGKYGTLGILLLEDIKFGGQLQTGIGIHAGQAKSADRMTIGKNAVIRNSGPFYRTQGCIRTSEAALHAIAAKIARDPLTFLRVKNNGKHPIGKIRD